MTTPTEAHVRGILVKHGFPALTVEFAACQGDANATYFAGDVVVRIAKNLEYVGDSYTESVAAPVAWAAGVSTPRMIAFDDDRDVIDAPVTLFERAPGRPAVSHPPGSRFFEELGREIARIHGIIGEVPDPQGWLDDHAWQPGRLLAGQWLQNESTLWREWTTRLATAYESMPAEVFLHGDAHLGNLMATDDGGCTAIIDWGDAGWGDPALDLGYVPARAVPILVRSYREARPVDDPNLEGRVLGLLAYRAVNKFVDFGATVLFDELSAFLAGPVPSGWERWWPAGPLR